MNTGTTELPTAAPEEVDRLIADYCRLAYEKNAMPHGMFEDPYIVCPWSGCGFRITGMRTPDTLSFRDPVSFTNRIGAKDCGGGAFTLTGNGLCFHQPCRSWTRPHERFAPFARLAQIRRCKRST